MRNVICDRCGNKIEESCIGKYYVGEWSEPKKKTSARVLDLCPDCLSALQFFIELPYGTQILYV